MNDSLPQPDSTALASSQTLQQLIADEIHAHNGWIPFSRFMEMALYTPQYGYYTGGAHKIGKSGDFITAPTLTPLFGQTLARQINELLPQTAGNVYEFGAGTGELAASMLPELSGVNHYYIVELSSELAERQRQTILNKCPNLSEKVTHLNMLPETFDGILIGNEVLDAMPIELIERSENTWWHIGVSFDEKLGFRQHKIPLASDSLLTSAQNYFPPVEPYTSELHPTQYAFIRTLSERLIRGAMIWIDYGFEAAQYYHPQRNQGTLIGHYRHHTIHDPFFHIGLTDLTAHVNFTNIAQAGVDSGLDLIGYLPQSYFLLNLGITEILEHIGTSQHHAYLNAGAAVQQLVGQHEMGELFKVIALGKNVDPDWLGFKLGDICHKL